MKLLTYKINLMRVLAIIFRNQSHVLLKVILIIAVTLLNNEKVYSQTTNTEMRGLSSLEITAEMAPGVNLWNTLDAVCWWCNECSNGLESETAWGNSYTTPEMVQAIADRGFKSLRIPVTWFNHMGVYPDYKIDEEWMDRVNKVVNYALDANMYVIINIHHDDYSEEHEGSWLCPTYEKQDAVTNQLVKVWKQIATRFKDYDDYLIFETMNEPREVGSSEEWNGGSKEHREVINAFNLAAVNAIRETGGNNETRFIMLPQVGANLNAVVEDMVIPNDDSNTIISVHAYTPYWFCLAEDGTDKWGTASEVAALDNALSSLSEKFVTNGIGVVIGEWGANNKNNYMQRINYYETYTNICKQEGLTPMPWIYSLNRETLTWENPLIEDAILQAYDSTYIPVEDLVLNIASDTLYVGDSLQLSATIFPDTASIKEIVWSSENKNIATVNSQGLLTAKTPGNVKIVTATIGKSSTCNLLVLDTLIHLNFHIEAEDFIDQYGIQTETCSDEGGGKNIGYIDNGDWCSYFIIVDSAAIYNFTARVATATNGGTIEIKANNNWVGKIEIEESKSNGWQNYYTTYPIEIELEAGAYYLKLNFNGGMNINWFEIKYSQAVISSAHHKFEYTNNFKVYPNPFSHKLSINYQLEYQSDIDIKIVDITGTVVQTIEKCNNKIPGNYTLVLDSNNLLNGVYFLILTKNKQAFTKKILLNK